MLVVSNIKELIKSPPFATPEALSRGFYKAGDLRNRVLWRWNDNGNKSNHNGWSIIDPKHSAIVGSLPWYSSEHNGTGVWERKGTKQLTVLDFGAKDEEGYDNTFHFQKMADATGMINIPESEHAFEIDSIITTRTTVIQAIEGRARIKLQPPDIRNTPGFKLVHTFSGISEGVHIDGNSTSRSCVSLQANDCFARIHTENVTADKDSTTYTSGVEVTGNRCSVFVSGKNFKNTGQENGSVPRLITVQGKSNNYNVNIRGHSVQCGLCLGRNTGRGSLGHLFIEDAEDNGIYQLGGILTAGNVCYNGNEEGIVVGGDLTIDKYLVIGRGVTAIGLNGGTKLRINNYQIQMEENESLGNILKTRSGKGFGSVEIDHIEGRLRGSVLMNLSRRQGDVDELIINNANLVYEYDEKVSGNFSQFMNLEAVKRLSIDNFSCRIIDINDEKPTSNFEIRLPKVTERSNFTYSRLQVLQSDEKTILSESGISIPKSKQSNLTVQPLKSDN